MLFSSMTFLWLFLPFTVIVNALLNPRYSNVFLLIMSLLFYAWGEPVYVLLMLLSILLNWLAGLLIGKVKKGKGALIFTDVLLNLSMLGLFKYYDFAAGSLNFLFGREIMAVKNIALPIGISFFTFQALSYVIDLYRGKCEVQKNPLNLALYISFFPQLIAGPIVRYSDIDRQILSRRMTTEGFAVGFRRFIYGLSKKVIISNCMAQIADKVFALSAGDLTFASAWIGALSYLMQIYYDFSGYSDMAIGLGKMFGFDFLENFRYPYLSRSIREFWQRWHISLGTWFREYVYIPLGGNRKGKVRQILNIFIVWALTGLWHGASWNFVFWGVYFGILLMIEKLFLLKFLKKIPAVFTHIYTLFLVVISWIFFYFETTDGIFSFMGRLFSLSDGLLSQDAAATVVANLPLLLIAFVACTPLAKKVHHKLEGKPFMPVVDAIAGVASLLLSVGALVYDSYNPFLYFRF